MTLAWLLAVCLSLFGPSLPSLPSPWHTEFREKAGLTEAAQVAQAWEVGLRGLETMRKYTGLRKESSDWVVTLEQDPLGAGAAAQRKAQLQAEASSIPVAPIVSAGVSGAVRKL